MTTPRHHPDDALLLAHAAATLDPATALVVAAHLEGCAHCRQALRVFDALGGDLLDRLAPAALDIGAFDRTLERLAAAPEPTPPGAGPQAPATPVTSTTPGRTHRPAPAPRARHTRPDLPSGMRWPRSLDGCDIGPWRRIGPGMRWSRIQVPGQPGANTFLLRMAAGKNLAAHTHTGRELTQVLYGAFDDGRAVWRAGDLDDTDASVHHHPVITADDECICLVALEGHVRFDGWIARRLGAWMGI